MKDIKKAWKKKKNSFSGEGGRIDLHILYIADDRQVGEEFQDFHPNSNVFCLSPNGPPGTADELLGVQTNFHDIVEQRKKWGERECCHEDGDESELHNCTPKRSKMIYNTSIPI